MVGGVGEVGQEGEDRKEPRVVGDLVFGGVAQAREHFGASGFGEAEDVSLRAGAGLGAPIEQARFDEPGDCGVEAAVADGSRVAGQLRDSLSQFVTVQWALGEEAEDGEFEYAASLVHRIEVHIDSM